MKPKTKIIIGAIVLVAIIACYFIIEMKDFADGVKHDAKKSKEFKPQKLSDSTSIISGDSTKPR